MGMHTILIGDAREQLAMIPAGTVQTCVTSPPYFGLRDYNVAGQIGLEPTVDAYVVSLVNVFREVRRVLKDDGTLWLNLGDSYVNAGGTGRQGESGQRADRTFTAEGMARRGITDGLKSKDLIGVPWRVAFALQSDGWYLRSEIIWHKPNPMPESVTDRPTKAHETVFLLSKSPRYYYDAAAIAEPSLQPIGEARLTGQHKADAGGFTTNGHGNSSLGTNQGAANRNRRSVWTMSTRPYAGAHFATFPPGLPRTCILAGTSERGECPACGAPWKRVVERESGYNGAGRATDTYTGQAYAHPQSAPRGPKSNFGPGNVGATKGWAPSCTCDAGEPVPQTVLDPFAGSGTTLEVAVHHGRRAIGVELNSEYVPLIERRLAQRTIWQALEATS